MLLALCCRLRGKSTKCWPSRETLARDAAPEGKTWFWRDLAPALDELERVGAIRVHARTGSRGESASYLYEVGTAGPLTTPIVPRETRPRQGPGKSPEAYRVRGNLPDPNSPAASATLGARAAKSPGPGPGENLNQGPGKNLTQGPGESPGRTPKRTPHRTPKDEHSAGTGSAPLRDAPPTASNQDDVFRRRAVAHVAYANALLGDRSTLYVPDLIHAQRKGSLVLSDVTEETIHDALDGLGFAGHRSI